MRKISTLIFVIITSLFGTVIIANSQFEQYIDLKGGFMNSVFADNDGNVFTNDLFKMYKYNIESDSWDIIKDLNKEAIIEAAGNLSTVDGDVLYYMTDKYEFFISFDNGVFWSDIDIVDGGPPDPEKVKLEVYNTKSGKVFISVINLETYEYNTYIVSFTAGIVSLTTVLEDSIDNAIDGEENTVYFNNSSTIVKLDLTNNSITEKQSHNLKDIFYSDKLYFLNENEKRIFSYDFATDKMDSLASFEDGVRRIENFWTVNIGNKIFISSYSSLFLNPLIIYDTKTNEIEYKPIEYVNIGFVNTGNTIFAATSIGMAKSDDNGNTWKTYIEDFNSFVSIHSWENDEIGLFSSVKIGTIKLNKENNELTSINTSALFSFNYFFDAAPNGNLFAFGLKENLDQFTFTLKMSKDYGDKWENSNINLEGIDVQFPPYLILDNDGNLLLSYGNYIFKSIDNGENWTEHIILDDMAWIIAVDNENNIYSAYDGLYKIDPLNGVNTILEDISVIKFKILSDNTFVLLAQTNNSQDLTVYTKRESDENWVERIIETFNDLDSFTYAIANNGDVIITKINIASGYTKILKLKDNNTTTSDIGNEILISVSESSNGDILAASLLGNLYRYKSVMSVFEKVNIERELVYPNPAQSSIRLTEFAKEASIIDINGKEHIKLKNAKEIDIQSLEPGAYFINYINSKGERKFSKLNKK